MMKGETPRARTGAKTFQSSRANRRWSRSLVRLPRRNHTTHTADTAWAVMVARAAPCTPMLKPKMRMGSSTMLTTAPMSTVAMPTVEKPWAVMKKLRPRESSTKMVPER